ncbi:hypothetical protein [Klebsiella pneumoniae]|uniref:hypothetical protein n=1 Tax=Klebsiella pneumoniae TaxID=573 RepID=UPI0019D6D12E|nr:hypothetical protein [Klebsiella pneumoniae]
MSDEIETIDKNPKSWAAWKREAERLQAIIDGMALAAMDSETAIADCDQEVYEKGVSVCLVAIQKETAEIICQNITAATGCKVDWHYFGGRVHIKALRVASQPAPVVPEEKSIPNTLSMYAVDAVAAIAEVKGWNACRAAMLAAAPQSPGSEPATVPGKWIPVSERMPDCWCLTCRPVVLNDMRFVVCPDCGNKRCPRANDHRNACTGSNEPGQEGGAYPDTPQEVKP